MSAKSGKSSPPRAPLAPHLGKRKIDAPFDPALWTRAARIAGDYRLIIQREGGIGYLGRAVELPMVMADGKTVARCAAATVDALTTAVAAMLERGESPPIAASSDKRSAQINIRVTEEERLRLESAAQRQGFRGLSDYVRSAALKEAS